jgi:4-amino-4-deoxy-L-arabinose transferase-like glycosyltransferase
MSATISATVNPSAATETSAAAAARSIWPLLAAGLAVRIVLWFWWSGLPIRIVDEESYQSLAVALVERGEFGFEPGVPTSLRPPLYPAFVAGLYSVFGTDALQVVRLVQLLLSLLIVVIAAQLATAAFSPRVGWWTAAFCCFYPSLLGANNLLLTETLFTLLLMTSCLLVVKAWQSGSAMGFAWAGAAIGLGALTRSVLWLFPPVLSLFLLALWPVPWQRRLLGTALLVASFALVIGPWAVRNTKLQQTLVLVDVMGGRNFMMGNYEHTPMFRAWDAISIDGERSWHAVLRRDYPSTGPLTQGQIDKHAMRAGLDFVKRHPGLSLQRAVAKFFAFWQLERELVAGAARGYFGPVNRVGLLIMTVVIFGSYVLALWSGLFGMFLAPPKDWRVHAFFILTMAFICGIHTLVFGHSRYHLPLMPIVLMYSASVATNVQLVWQQRRSLRFGLATLCCLVFAAAWSFEVFVLDLSRFANALNQT